MTTAPLRIVIVEDEVLGLEAFLGLMANYPQLEVVGQASDIETAVKVIHQTEPDVVFLDIRLGNRSGFDILQKLAYKKFYLVITSAYHEYALNAIREEAIDYLLKPVAAEELSRAIQRIRERQKANVQFSEQQWSAVQQSVARLSWDRISVPTSTGMTFISTMQIMRCIAEGPYTKLILKASMPLLTTRNLGEYEKSLTPEQGFFRIHNHVIINIREVVRYVRGDGGHVIMTDGEKVDVSRRKKTEFLTWVQQNEVQ